MFSVNVDESLCGFGHLSDTWEGNFHQLGAYVGRYM